jgi:hypothetical protein
MNVVKATRSSEKWLAFCTRIDEKDLRLRHARTEAERFPFFRATQYCWAQLWPQIGSDLAEAPQVLAVELVLHVVRSDWEVWKKQAYA